MVRKTGYSSLAGMLAAATFSATSVGGLPVAAAPAAQDTAASPGYCSSSIAPYRDSVFLAYIRSSSTADSVAESGLKALAARLTEKTSLEASVKNKNIKVTGIDIETQDICFFPSIYWPVDVDSQPLSSEAQLKVQTYLARGGFIMFDIRDAGLEWRSTLKNLLGAVNIGTLEPMQDNHILRNTFYRNSNLPGSINLEPVYVQKPFRTDGDRVSQVVVSTRNWAAAWAGLTFAPGSAGQEMALRGGINMILYFYTGNYKQDQIEAGRTLEKIGLKP